MGRYSNASPHINGELADSSLLGVSAADRTEQKAAAAPGSTCRTAGFGVLSGIRRDKEQQEENLGPVRPTGCLLWFSEAFNAASGVSPRDSLTPNSKQSNVAGSQQLFFNKIKALKY